MYVLRRCGQEGLGNLTYPDQGVMYVTKQRRKRTEKKIQEEKDQLDIEYNASGFLMDYSSSMSPDCMN